MNSPEPTSGVLTHAGGGFFSFRPIPSAPGYTVSHDGRVKGPKGLMTKRDRVDIMVRGYRITRPVKDLVKEAWPDGPMETGPPVIHCSETLNGRYVKQEQLTLFSQQRQLHLWLGEDNLL